MSEVKKIKKAINRIGDCPKPIEVHLFDKASNYVGFVEGNNLYNSEGKLVKPNISKDSKIAVLISILLSRKQSFLV